MTLSPDEVPTPKRSLTSLFVVTAIGLVLITALIALGTWQVKRLSWKLDLIAKVDARVHAQAVAAPGPAAWPSVSADHDEYRRVTVSGHFLQDKETAVYASTALGPGYWIMTPLQTAGGSIMLINRGFVPLDKRSAMTRTAGQIEGDATVVGLIRMSEPKGTLLRANAPADDRWYSRDVTAIAASRGLGQTAPYFIDADATPNAGGYPVGGLTQIAFSNSHLVYAITWYCLAIMVAGMLVILWRQATNTRRQTGEPLV